MGSTGVVESHAVSAAAAKRNKAKRENMSDIS
jgi:hypothetical protein